MQFIETSLVSAKWRVSVSNTLQMNMILVAEKLHTVCEKINS